MPFYYVVVGLPGVATSTDDGDGGAVNTDLAGNGAKDNAEETSQETDNGVAGLRDGVAYRVEIRGDRPS